MSSRPATPPLAITCRPVMSARAEVACTLTPLSIPSRLMSVYRDTLDANGGHAVAQLDSAHLADVLPAVRGDLALFGVEADQHLRVRPIALWPPAQVPDSRTAAVPQDDAIGTEGEGQLDVVQTAKAAGELDRDINRLANLLETVQVGRQLFKVQLRVA